MTGSNFNRLLGLCPKIVALNTLLAFRYTSHLPLGTVEWHGGHLPVGLDGLTAHGLCVRGRAARTGGLVYPPLFYGLGGSLNGSAWTVMLENTAEDRRAFARLLRHTLVRLESFGVGRAVVFLRALQRLAAGGVVGARERLAREGPRSYTPLPRRVGTPRAAAPARPRGPLRDLAPVAARAGRQQNHANKLCW